MYHSHLLINVGNNPDRPDWNICRKWLRNLYRVHQRLCMAFPSAAPVEEAQRKAAYCKPFAADAFAHLRDLPEQPGNENVHTARTDGAGFLFRIDHPVDTKHRGRMPVIIVQSAEKPDWEFAFGLDKTDTADTPTGNADFLLAAPPQVRQISIELDGEALVLESQKQKYLLNTGDTVRFRLRANPTRKVQDGSKNGVRKRIETSLEEHFQWLCRKLENAAEFPDGTKNLITFAFGWAHGWRTKYEPHQPGTKMKWWSVLFEGTFQVKDTVQLKQLLTSGIGPAKAFGFGLLSVAPV